MAGAATQGHYGDLWWSPAESGWGLSITQQASTLFAVWYAYRSDGRPVWYVLPGGSWVSGDTYTGTLGLRVPFPQRLCIKKVGRSRRRREGGVR